jgi:hypothetical protein
MSGLFILVAAAVTALLVDWKHTIDRRWPPDHDHTDRAFARRHRYR